MKPGTRLGRYEVLRPLGSGGMGEVYAARDDELGREVAIKVVHERLTGQAQQLARFRREARAIAGLRHPHILTIYDFGIEGDVAFAVTELLEGETLRKRLQAGPLPLGDTVALAVAIAEGLQAAHEQGVTHRDIKPENVFITSAGAVKILDFGLARVAPPLGGVENETAMLTATLPGTVMGTMGYMAPEQIRGTATDPRTDIFALGCVLYEMLTGTRAFSGPTHADTASAILKDHPAPPSASGPASDTRLDDVVLRCLAKEPDARYQSSADVAAALRTLFGDPYAGDGEPTARRDETPSIAVLPFANLSADAEQEYFCDGMAEEIINALAHLAGLRVIARTSSFAFKGHNTDIRNIGAKLGVGCVLEGSVRKAGQRLRITAKLIDVEDGSNLWSQRFDRELEDVFAIQDEIAAAVVENLEVQLFGGEPTARPRRPPANLEAYNAYLQGLYFWNMLTPEGYRRSRECYEKAIRIDASLVDAYAQLSVWHGSQAFWGTVPPRETHPRAFALAEKALSLDPGHADALASLGVGQAFGALDWAAGEASMRKAARLAPNHAIPWANLSAVLTMKGEWPEAVEAARRAQRLDPLSPTTMVWTASWMGYAGEVDEGAAELRRQRAMRPDHWLPAHYLGDMFARQGRHAEALAELEAASALSNAGSITLALLAIVHFLTGDRPTGDEIIARLRRRAEEVYVPPMFLTWAHLAQGNEVAALQCAQEALDAGDLWIGFHRVMAPSLVPRAPGVEELLAPCLP